MEEEKHNKNMISKIKQKFEERKTVTSNKKYRIKNPLSAHYNDVQSVQSEVTSNYTNEQRSRIKSEANTSLMRKNNKIYDKSKISFIDYKKNKRFAEFSCRRALGLD